jgi:hypothetical protein
MQHLIHSFVDAVWEDVESQLRLDCEVARPMEFDKEVQRMRSRIIDSLVNNPSHFPKRPSRKERPQDIDAWIVEKLL